ncbi:MAG: phosphate ABC transporter ATP-binding protein [Anaerolineales bacterium]
MIANLILWDMLFSLDHVSKEYNSRKVLDIDHLTIERGEVLAIVGPNGAGKSTLLRLLNFLEPPSSGSIYFDRRLVPARVPLALRRRVTTVFQRPQLLTRSVVANVAFGMQLRDRDARGLAAAALERVGLGAMAHAPARKLSGGEMQRVALARAFVLQPDALLLDEPTANLDPHNVSLIERVIAEQNVAHGTTIVLVTHNIFQARRMAHRCGLLLEGKLVEVTNVETFFSSPQDARTSAFVGGKMVY